MNGFSPEPGRRQSPRLSRWLGIAAISIGVALLAWTAVVRFWHDPVTAVYAEVEQHRLAQAYDNRFAAYHSVAQTLGVAAARYRTATREGEPLGWITIHRLGLHAVLVDGTNESDLTRGPGLYRGDFLPGEGHLVYIAGHRTTYSAPFAYIERLRPGDVVVISLPYGTFEYKITGHKIVTANDVAVLRTGRTEQLILQSCHPRFSATHRYLAYARLVSATATHKPN
ncbi:MAG TPA: class E sortase [Gaiellaceae bacterium]